MCLSTDVLPRGVHHHLFDTADCRLTHRVRTGPPGCRIDEVVLVASSEGLCFIIPSAVVQVMLGAQSPQ